MHRSFRQIFIWQLFMPLLFPQAPRGSGYSCSATFILGPWFGVGLLDKLSVRAAIRKGSLGRTLLGNCCSYPGAFHLHFSVSWIEFSCWV